MRVQLSVAALVGASLLAAPAARATQDGVLSGTAQPTMQTNGTVWHLAYGAGVVFAIGDFTTVRPSGAASGSGTIARKYVAAFDASTGALLPFAPSFNREPSSVATSPKGNRVYFGGPFTSVDGQSVGRAVAFDVPTGALLPNFDPAPDGDVTAIAAVKGRVYLAGSFKNVGGQPHQDIAAVSRRTGNPTKFDASLDGRATTLSVTKTGKKLYVGGYFTHVNGTNRRTVTLLNGRSGAKLRFPASSAMPSVTTHCTSTVKDSVVSHGVVYFAAEGFGAGCFDGTWAAKVAGGKLLWKNQCLGATQTVEVVHGWLYKGSHAHDCGRINPIGDPDAFPQVNDGQGPRHLLAQSLAKGFLGPWYPNTNNGSVHGTLGPRDMATDGSNLWVAGEFTTVNKLAQEGLVRFGPTPDTAPQTPSTPTASATGGGKVQVVATMPYDIDDTDLQLALYRDGAATPLAVSPVQHVLFWKLPVIVFVDGGLSSGSTHSYRVAALEAHGSLASAKSPSVQVVVS